MKKSLKKKLVNSIKESTNDWVKELLSEDVNYDTTVKKEVYEYLNEKFYKTINSVLGIKESFSDFDIDKNSLLGTKLKEEVDRVCKHFVNEMVAVIIPDRVKKIAIKSFERAMYEQLEEEMYKYGKSYVERNIRKLINQMKPEIENSLNFDEVNDKTKS